MDRPPYLLHAHVHTYTHIHTHIHTTYTPPFGNEIQIEPRSSIVRSDHGSKLILTINSIQFFLYASREIVCTMYRDSFLTQQSVTFLDWIDDWMGQHGVIVVLIANTLSWYRTVVGSYPSLLWLSVTEFIEHYCSPRLKCSRLVKWKRKGIHCRLFQAPSAAMIRRMLVDLV